MSYDEPGELADQREAEVSALERRGDEIDRDVDEVRQDWQRKRQDQSVPGAVPEERDESDEELPPSGTASTAQNQDD